MIANTEKRKNIMFCLIGVLVSTFILLISFYVSKIYPFGDNTIIYHDLEYQYYDLFGWLRNVFHGEDGIFYSFNIGMGSGTLPMIAYYLASPFNLLVVFADENNLVLIITLIIVLKILACVPTSYIYLVRRFNIKNKYVMLLAVAYSMMEYNVLNNSNVMWLDAVIVMPLVALGIYKLVNGGKTVLYFVSLLYAVLFTFYTGYMICIFAVGYFALEEVVLAINKEQTKETFLRDLGKFVLTSILACFSTAVLLIPNIFQTLESGSINNETTYYFRSFAFIKGFKDLFLNGEQLTKTGSAPAIFVGSLPLIILSGVILPKRICIQKRLIIIAVLLMGILAYYIAPVNYAFSMFSRPNNHMYRHSFMYSFLLIAMAGYYLDNANINAWDYVIGGVIISILSIVHCVIEGNTPVVWSIVIILGMSIALFVDSMGQSKAISIIATVIMCSLMVVEHSLDWKMELSDHVYSYERISEYDNALHKKIVEINDEGGFYRMDKLGTRFNSFDRSECNIESANFKYSSLSSYLSTRCENTGRFMQKMGYSSEPKIELYDCVQPIDSILGVKYIFAKKMPEGYELLDMDANGICTYVNPYLLPLALEYKNEAALEDRNPFNNHKELLYSIGLSKKDIYIEPDIYEMNENESITRQYKFVANTDGPMYCYVINGDGTTTISVDDKLSLTNIWYSNQIVYMGDYHTGDSLLVTVSGGDTNEYEVVGCSIDLCAMESVFLDFQNNACKIIDVSNERIEFSYKAEEDSSLMITIPYESSWKVKVNGKESKCKLVNDTFIGINVSEGNNKVILEYCPKGLTLGMIISILSIATFCVFVLFERRKRVT